MFFKNSALKSHRNSPVLTIFFAFLQISYSSSFASSLSSLYCISSLIIFFSFPFPTITPYYFFFFSFFFFHIRHLIQPFLNLARHVNFTWNTDSSRFNMKFEMIRNMRSLAPNLGESKRCSFWLQNGKFWNWQNQTITGSTVPVRGLSDQTAGFQFLVTFFKFSVFLKTEPD